MIRRLALAYQHKSKKKKLHSLIKERENIKDDLQLYKQGEIGGGNIQKAEVKNIKPKAKRHGPN